MNNDIFAPDYFESDAADEAVTTKNFFGFQVIKSDKKAKNTSFNKTGLDANTYSDWADTLREDKTIQQYRAKYSNAIDSDDDSDKLVRIENALAKYISQHHKIEGCTKDDIRLFVHNYLDG